MSGNSAPLLHDDVGSFYGSGNKNYYMRYDLVCRFIAESMKARRMQIDLRDCAVTDG